MQRNKVRKQNSISLDGEWSLELLRQLEYARHSPGEHFKIYYKAAVLLDKATVTKRVWLLA